MDNLLTNEQYLIIDKFLFPFRKILAIFFSVYFMVLAIGQPIKPIEPLDKKNLQLDVTVMSDIHMEGTVFNKHVMIPKCFKELWGGKKYIDAIAMVGDNSLCAENIENIFFFSVLKYINPIKSYYPAMGNHEVGCGDPQFGTFEELREKQLGYLNSFVDKNINELYYSEVVNGYRLIFMGPDAPEEQVRTLSDKQLDWFEAELDKAAESGLPVFVFNHHPYGVIGQGHDRYVSLLNKYDNIFVLVGHAHYPPQVSIVPGEKGTPEIYVPSLTCNNDDINGTGYQMEVYKDKVVFRLFNYLAGNFTGQEFSYTLK